MSDEEIINEFEGWLDTWERVVGAKHSFHDRLIALARRGASLTAAPGAVVEGKLGCADCGRPYGEEHGFPDLVLPDDAWSKISPRPDGNGVLCPSCICKRAYDAGLEGIQAVFRSGPFVAPGAVVDDEMDTLRARCAELEGRDALRDGTARERDDLIAELEAALKHQRPA